MKVIDIPLDQILVVRTDRQRKALVDVEELAGSMSVHGLINPITVAWIAADQYKIVAGERRLAAAKLLEWPEIPCCILQDMTEGERQAVELEENIRRKDLPWQDRVLAVARVVALFKEDGKSQEDAARYLGLKPTALNELNMLGRGMQKPAFAHIAKIGSLTTALGVFRNSLARASADELERFTIRPAGAVPEEGTPTVLSLPTDQPAAIIQANFHEWLVGHAGERFNLIHCDFPFGIQHDKSEQGAAERHGAFVDDPETYWSLCKTLADGAERLMAYSAHIMFWLSMNRYEETRAFFAERVPSIVWDKFPLIWHKTDNVGMVPDANRGPRRVYETAIFGSRGDRPIIRPVANCIGYPSSKASAAHLSEKPTAVVKHFFRMFVDDSTRMLDPTCGSGSAVVAASELKAARALGLELDAKVAASAQDNLTRAFSFDLEVYT